MTYLLALTLVLILASVSSADTVEVTWQSAVIDGAHAAPTSYKVKCGTAKGGPYTTYATVPYVTGEVINQAVITLASPGGPYFCVVTAVNSAGESSPGREFEISVGTVPNSP